MTKADILHQRLERVQELRRLGRLGVVTPSMVEVLLGLSRSRVRDLIEEGALPVSGYNGFRLVSLEDVIGFAKASSKRPNSMLR